MHRLRRSLLLVALATSAVLVPALPAAAVPGSAAGTLVGSGTSQPGFTVPFQDPQSIFLIGKMAGSFAAGTAAETATLDCAFAGGTTPGSVGTATMSLDGTCAGTGVTAPVSLVCSFRATISYPPLCVVLTGTCTLTVDPTRVTFAATLRLCFVYTTTSPATSFSVTGDLAGATPI
ncbi:MAG TPA: hypothetical protein VGB03_00250 [Acidimicrobiales bacterium]|jgi:hypothetical protein